MSQENRINTPNEAQELAIATRKNALVSAGAGSGKTSVLTSRFLALLIENTDWQMNNVVAITFTKAAALEMKGRIRSRLIRLSQEAGERATLAKFAPKDTTDEAQQARWADLLKQIDSARIDTIHAFCADILRANAPEAEIDPRFGILDEADAGFLKQQAYDEVLKHALQDPDAPFLRLFESGGYDADKVRETVTDGNLLGSLPDVLHYNDAPTENDPDIAKGWVDLLMRVKDGYQALKASVGVLDYDDLEGKTAQVLQNLAVRDRYRDIEYKHIMVDEFQDTNPRQWQIVKALANLDEPNRVFLVGDVKQSIYKFRGADVRVFLEARSIIEESFVGEMIQMGDSYRSSKPLVEQINGVFGQLFTGELAYEPMSSARLQTYPDTPISTILLIPPKGVEVEVRDWEAFLIAQRLKETVNAQTLIYDKDARQERPFVYSDAVILLRSLTQVGHYERAFDALGVPYVTLAKRGYYKRQEVWDVANALKALYAPDDNLALASALRSPLVGLSDETLFCLRQDRNITLFDAVVNAPHHDFWGIPDDEERQRLGFFAETLEALRGIVGKVTIAELLHELLARTGFLATLTALKGGARQRRNVEKMLEFATEKSHLSLGEFVRYVNDLMSKEANEGEASQDEGQGVRIMSIHGSKGLEFPLVILPHFENQGRIIPPELLFDEQGCLVYKGKKINDKDGYNPAYEGEKALYKKAEDAELRRLLYVAITRAQDAVWIYGKDYGSGFVKLFMEGTGKKRKYILLSPTFLNTPPNDLQDLLAQSPQAQAWETLDISELPAPQAPPSYGAVPTSYEQTFRHISATQLADIGGVYYHNDNYHRRNLRLSLAEPVDQENIRLNDPKVTRLVVGQMVHEAIRHQQFPSNTSESQLKDILHSYAWRFHLTDESDLALAVNRAKNDLEKFERSDVYQWIKEARAIYAELPFLYRTGMRILHGQMDMLLQKPDGQWVILDYKTSYVESNEGKLPTQADADQHAQRYYLQLGAYASAVQTQFSLQGKSITPRVYVHYIRYNLTVEVETEAWRGALEKIEPIIGDVLARI